MVVSYPRSCDGCGNSYVSKQTYCNHKRLGRCRQDVSSVEVIAQCQRTLADIDTVSMHERQCKYTQKELSDLKELDALMKEQGMDVEKLKTTINEFQHSWQEILCRKFPIHRITMEHVRLVNEAFDEDFPLKENNDGATVIDLAGRDILLLLTLKIWKKLFFPTVHGRIHQRPYIIPNLIQRPFRVEQACGKKQVKIELCENRVWQHGQYEWVRDDWKEILNPSFMHLYETIVTVLKKAEFAYNISRTLLNGLQMYLSQDREIYLPKTMQQEMVAHVIKDSDLSLVNAWFIFHDVFEYLIIEK